LNIESEYKLQRRVAGHHDIRMDGLADLVVRARDASVFDIGCNRGLVSFEMANNGARMCHGCDVYKEGIEAARDTFIKMNESRDLIAKELALENVHFDRERHADLRACEFSFQVVDLSKGYQMLKQPFGETKYDIALMLATYHKLKRVMNAHDLSRLMETLGERTKKWFGWRGTSEKANETEVEMRAIDKDLERVGMKRIHTSHISLTLGVAAIWQRQ
jgi:hypothetical protein